MAGVWDAESGPGRALVVGTWKGEQAEDPSPRGLRLPGAMGAESCV